VNPLIEYFSGGGTVADLQANRCIQVIPHAKLPLDILLAHKTDSNKIDPVTRECRGTVIERGTNRIVAKSFKRFFDYRHAKAGDFDWEDFMATVKEDGIMTPVYSWEGRWFSGTKGTFGDRVVSGDKTHQENFWHVSRIDPHGLDPAWTYVFELCVDFPGRIKRYARPKPILLTMFDPVTCRELSDGEIAKAARFIRVARPTKIEFDWDDPIAEIKRFLGDNDIANGMSPAVPGIEGLVVKDCNGERLKFKTKTWEYLHRLNNNGMEVEDSALAEFHFKVNSGFLWDFPVERLQLQAVQVAVKIGDAYDELKYVWLRVKDIEGQKEFAEAVKDEPFSFVLFKARKLRDFPAAWYDSGSQIVKKLFGEKKENAQ